MALSAEGNASVYGEISPIIREQKFVRNDQQIFLNIKRS